MSVRGAGQSIKIAVSAWEGVTAHPHRFGGTEYRLGSREIGHVHGDGLVDIPFPTRVRNELVTAGRAVPHHVLPESGWVSVYIRKPEDVDEAIALLRRSYDLAVSQRAEARARDAR
jgi:luciferase-like monooxygenase